MGIFTTNLKNVNRFFVENPIFLEEISSCPSTHQCCNSRLIIEVLVCQGSVVCFGADDYGQSKTEISQKNARMVTVVVRCCRPVLSDFAELENLMVFFCMEICLIL